MPSKGKRPKATKSQPEVWVSPDLMNKLKGTDGHRAGSMPQSPYLALADHFLGLAPSESGAGKAAHRAAPAHPGHKTREAAETPEPPPRAMAAAAAAGAASEGVLSSIAPRMIYPKPPARPNPPRPPKLAVARLNVPKLQAPKPPKMSFGYRRRKVDRQK